MWSLKRTLDWHGELNTLNNFTIETIKILDKILKDEKLKYLKSSEDSRDKEKTETLGWKRVLALSFT